jgi:RHS repeat-associated protein
MNRSFTHGPGIDEVLGMTDYTGYNTEDSFFHHDGMGSIVNITDASEVLKTTYTYNPFGEFSTTHNNGTIDSPFTYAGREFSATTGLYKLGNRMYLPQIGRFLSRDSRSYSTTSPKTINRYNFKIYSSVNSSYKRMHINTRLPSNLRVFGRAALQDIWFEMSRDMYMSGNYEMSNINTPSTGFGWGSSWCADGETEYPDYTGQDIPMYQPPTDDPYLGVEDQAGYIKVEYLPTVTGTATSSPTSTPTFTATPSEDSGYVSAFEGGTEEDNDADG